MLCSPKWQMSACRFSPPPHPWGWPQPEKTQVSFFSPSLLLCLLALSAVLVSPCSHLPWWVSTCMILISSTICYSSHKWGEFPGRHRLYHSHILSASFLIRPHCYDALPLTPHHVCTTARGFGLGRVACSTKELWGQGRVDAVFKQRFWEESRDSFAFAFVKSIACPEWRRPSARVLGWKGTDTAREAARPWGSWCSVAAAKRLPEWTTQGSARGRLFSLRSKILVAGHCHPHLSPLLQGLWHCWARA